MTIALIVVASVVVMAAVYAIVVRGSLGLVKKRLDEDPELSRPVPDDKLDDDHLPADIEY